MPEAASTRELLRVLEQPVAGVVEEISSNDQMRDTNPEYYFEAGQLALRCVRLALLAAGRTEVRSVLDLPCGHGRVLRTLKAAFPEAELTACDINRDGVDFCARVLGARPVYSAPHSKDVALEGPFDLIWVGSLLTHLDLEGTRGFLDLFESVLSPDRGLLVFTTHGRMTAERARVRARSFGVLKRREIEQRYGAHPRELAWGMTKDQIETLLEGYDREGFGYVDWFSEEQRAELSMPLNYGISVADPSWVCREVERRPLRLVAYKEGGWGHRQDWWSQDVVACVRMPG